MAASDIVLGPEDYQETLRRYVETHGEEALYLASSISRALVASGLGPEDVVALHFECLQKILIHLSPRQQARIIGDAHQFLLDVMIAYGVHFKEYLELKLNQAVRDAESRAARERERVHEAERIQLQERELLAMIAHELRTPITAARGNLDLATRSLSQGRVDNVPRLLGMACDAVDRLSRLSADLVEASRGEPPQVHLVPIDVNAIAEQACSWARPAAASKSVNLIQEPTPTPVIVRASADGLLSILGNLLSNAIRYTHNGGTVVVRTQRNNGTVTIEVADDGIGMAPEVIDRIFDKFYRGQAARRIDAHGLGLGLPLVKQLVAAHGGQIEVASAPEQGSTFRVILPVVTADRDTSDARGKDDQADESARIDHPATIHHN